MVFEYASCAYPRRSYTGVVLVQKIFTISPENWALVMKDERLGLMDIRVLGIIMSEHANGPFTLGQGWIADQLSAHPGNIRKSCQKLEELQYIIRQKNKKGDVTSILINPFFMFNGRRNQARRSMDMNVRDVIARNRKIYYDKLAKDKNDYPNAGMAVWPEHGKSWSYPQVCECGGKIIFAGNSTKCCEKCGEVDETKIIPKA